jgi:myo-inositol-1(or 4)-monophosphatase
LNLETRLTFAEDLARRAGDLALRYFNSRDSLTVEAKRNPQDMVSEADRSVELLIREAIGARFPEDGILGEEFGLQPGTSGLTWIIDPIDGTAPFLAGLPGWCVSIGALDADGPAIGVIRVPVLDESYAAARGLRASLNGTPVCVAQAVDLRTGLLGIGANDRIPAERLGAALADIIEAGGNWVRYGSGALMLAWVAAGRLVGYVEPRMSAWDCMAGYCLIEAAGGRVLPFPTGDRLTLPAPVLGAVPGEYDRIRDLMRLGDDGFWR